MPRYQHREVSFEPPAGWTDSTVARFHPEPSPAGSPPAPSITMEHARIAPGVTARTYADHALVRLARTVRGFAFLNREELTIDERPTVLLRFQFSPHEESSELLEQTMAIVTAGAEGDRAIVVLSMACPAEQARSAMPVFSSVLRSLRFDEGASSLAPAPMTLAPATTAIRPPPPSDAHRLEFPQTPMPGIRGR